MTFFLPLSQGKYKEAEPLYLRAISIKETTLGEDHPNVSTGLHNLATLLEEKVVCAEVSFGRFVLMSSATRHTA